MTKREAAAAAKKLGPVANQIEINKFESDPGVNLSASPYRVCAVVTVGNRERKRNFETIEDVTDFLES